VPFPQRIFPQNAVFSLNCIPLFSPLLLVFSFPSPPNDKELFSLHFSGPPKCPRAHWFTPQELKVHQRYHHFLSAQVLPYLSWPPLDNTNASNHNLFSTLFFFRILSSFPLWTCPFEPFFVPPFLHLNFSILQVSLTSDFFFLIRIFPPLPPHFSCFLCAGSLP